MTIGHLPISDYLYIAIIPTQIHDHTSQLMDFILMLIITTTLYFMTNMKCTCLVVVLLVTEVYANISARTFTLTQQQPIEWLVLKD